MYGRWEYAMWYYDDASMFDEHEYETDPYYSLPFCGEAIVGHSVEEEEDGSSAFVVYEDGRVSFTYDEWPDLIDKYGLEKIDGWYVYGPARQDYVDGNVLIGDAVISA